MLPEFLDGTYAVSVPASAIPACRVLDVLVQLELDLLSLIDPQRYRANIRSLVLGLSPRPSHDTYGADEADGAACRAMAAALAAVRH